MCWAVNVGNDTSYAGSFFMILYETIQFQWLGGHIVHFIFLKFTLNGLSFYFSNIIMAFDMSALVMTTLLSLILFYIMFSFNVIIWSTLLLNDFKILFIFALARWLDSIFFKANSFAEIIASKAVASVISNVKGTFV